MSSLGRPPRVREERVRAAQQPLSALVSSAAPTSHLERFRHDLVAALPLDLSDLLSCGVRVRGVSIRGET